MYLCVCVCPCFCAHVHDRLLFFRNTCKLWPYVKILSFLWSHFISLPLHSPSVSLSPSHIFFRRHSYIQWYTYYSTLGNINLCFKIMPCIVRLDMREENSTNQWHGFVNGAHNSKVIKNSVLRFEPSHQVPVVNQIWDSWGCSVKVKYLSRASREDSNSKMQFSPASALCKKHLKSC